MSEFCVQLAGVQIAVVDCNDDDATLKSCVGNIKWYSDAATPPTGYKGCSLFNQWESFYKDIKIVMDGEKLLKRVRGEKVVPPPKNPIIPMEDDPKWELVK